MNTQYGINLFVVIFSLIVAYLISLQAMFSAAKKSDPEFFEEMGSPHIILNNRPKHTVLILKALLSLKHIHSNSFKVKLWGSVSLFLFAVISISFVVFIYVSTKSS